MADKSILFSAPMIRALMDGRKTQTRRVLKTQPGELDSVLRDGGGHWHVTDSQGAHMSELRLPYATGARLYVREGFVPAPMEAAPSEPRPTRWNIAYAAGGQAEIMAPAGYNPMLYNYERWSPSIHMPRWASRLTLTVTDVSVQRLQDISEADAVAEGVKAIRAHNALWAKLTPENLFAALWNSLHGPDAWAANPWVVALTFDVHRCNIDQMENGDG